MIKTVKVLIRARRLFWCKYRTYDVCFVVNYTRVRLCGGGAHTRSVFSHFRSDTERGKKMFHTLVLFCLSCCHLTGKFKHYYGLIFQSDKLQFIFTCCCVKTVMYRPGKSPENILKCQGKQWLFIYRNSAGAQKALFKTLCFLFVCVSFLIY